MARTPAALLDASAITLSTLCLLHCLALPLLAAALPLLGAWAEAEWVHVVFVIIAVPLSGHALWRAHRLRRLPRALLALATAGLACLVAGAVEMVPGAWETVVTVAGSLMLAGAHLWNWSRHHRH